MIRKTSDESADLLAFLRPFSRKLWMLALCTCIYAGILICLIERADNEHLQNRPIISQLILSIWYCFGNIVGYGVEFNATTAAGRFLTVGLYILSLILVASYTANLASDLTIAKTQFVISGIDDIKNGEIPMNRIGIRVGTASEDFFKTEITGGAQNYYPLKTRQQLYDSLLSGVIDVTLSDSGIAEYAVNSIYCNLTIVGNYFDTTAFAIVTPKQWLYAQDLDVGILSLKESGKIDNIRQKWFQAQHCPDSTATTTTTTAIEIKAISGHNIKNHLSQFINYARSDTPKFVSHYGLTMRSSVRLNDQLYEIVVSSEEVPGEQKIRILFPHGYDVSGNNHRYPVLYLLHGSFGGAADWTTLGEAQAICGNTSLITVMPNGDPFGFYTNWVILGNDGPQNWRTYHMEQLVPWIDYNLRTVAKKEGRAIAGLSMGGFGAIRYAEQYSDNFIYMAGFSGVADLLDKRVQQVILDLTTIDYGKPLLGPFGYPSEPLNSSEWFAQDPITHAESLRGVAIAQYTGNGDDFEKILCDTNYRLRDMLISFKIPLYFNDYGSGQSIGYGCNGGHNWPCWNAALIDVLPRMMMILQKD
ncbi:unnamed protein product [Rotaria sp. Silwood1]|nr:unnamed protein product [Rotaria sp. Silwood1]